MQSFNEHLIKEAIKFHIETNRPFCDNTFRPYTDEFYELYREAKRMWKSGEIEVKESFEKEMLSTDIGEFVEVNGELLPLDLPLMEDDKDVEIGKPKRGGPKKYYVYVRDPSSGNVKKVSWGDTTGLKAKINDPEARKSFAARHKCDQKKDKTKAGYWACRLPRYAKALGLSVDSPGTWW